MNDRDRPHSIRDFVLAMANGSTSARQALEHGLGNIEQHNARINAIPTLVPPSVLEKQVSELDQRISAGLPVGMLAGVPWCAKDTHETAGLRTTFGSPIYAKYVPDVDHPIVSRLRAADCLLVGKSNAPEFAAGAQTTNAVLGTTLNPWDTSKTVGGSTGGGAAAVATGMVMLADGSDLGASLRNPASFCGVTGLRPSSRNDPSLNPGPNVFSDLSQVGAVTQSVDDLRLAEMVIRRPPQSQPLAQWAAYLTDEAHRRQAARRPLRIAYSVDCGGGFEVAPAVRISFETAIDTLREAGVELHQAHPDFSGADPCFLSLRAQFFVESFGHLLHTNRQQLKESVVWNIEQGLAQNSAQLTEAMLLRSKIHQRVEHFISGYDAWLLPTAQVLPFDAALPQPETITGAPLANYIDWLQSCYWLTVSGQPAASIPAGFGQDDAGAPALPFGMQVVGRWGHDVELLDVAERLEAHFQSLNHRLGAARQA